MEYIRIRKSSIDDRISHLLQNLRASEMNGDNIRAGIEYHQVKELRRVLMMSEPDVLPDNNELDTSGRLVFKHKTNKRLFLERPFRWADRLILLDETEGRQVIDEHKFSTYDLSAWEPMTKEEYNKVKNCYKEIYEDSEN